LDVGCGWGRSFKLLHERFKSSRMVGIDTDPHMLEASEAEIRRYGLSADLLLSSAARIPLSDASTDLILCHQTFHHLVYQEAALQEFFRVLKPGGVLLMAESTRRYIHSWIIRLLFHHDMDVQRTAEEYLAMIRDAGFRVDPGSISYPYLWWSRPDLGLLERAFDIQPPREREETLINLVAVRP
jgi:Methylase involved in ubiquinone/menaquinone biosynthesis